MDWKSLNFRKSRPVGSVGQATVEFTLSAVLFFLFTFLIVEGARMVYYYSTISHATREGVRYAIVRGSTSTCPSDCPASAADIEAYVRAVAVGAHLKAVDVCWWNGTPDCSGDPHNPANKNPGSTVQVSVELDYKPVLPFVPQNLVSLASTSQMTISQ